MVVGEEVEGLHDPVNLADSSPLVVDDDVEALVHFLSFRTLQPVARLEVHVHIIFGVLQHNLILFLGFTWLLVLIRVRILVVSIMPQLLKRVHLHHTIQVIFDAISPKCVRHFLLDFLFHV